VSSEGIIKVLNDFDYLLYQFRINFKHQKILVLQKYYYFSFTKRNILKMITIIFIYFLTACNSVGSCHILQPGVL